MEIAIIGGGITGLALAMNLHARGIASCVYESAPEVRELGVGITLLPHAMRELTALGLADAVLAQGIENRYSRFFNRFGQLIYEEPRGKFAGYDDPEVGIHRGRLHTTMFEAARARLGAERIRTDHHCVGLEQDATGVTIAFKSTATGAPRDEVRADLAIACDGVNSAVRRQFYPDEQLAFGGINLWRGITRWPPVLGGRSYIRVGSINTGKVVMYPIIDDVDGQGNQLINWAAEIRRDSYVRNDWNQPGRIEDFIHLYADWRFDWLDMPAMMRAADAILEYPMVDKDPVGRWSFGRVTLAGDAAHPMYPRGSNGAAQGLIDARTLADELMRGGDPPAALARYETIRRPATARVVETNRSTPPDIICIKVEELTGDKPFASIDAVISQQELRALSDGYKAVAGFALADLKRA